MAETRLPKQKITNDMSTSASRASRRPLSCARSSSRSPRSPSRARRRRRSGSSSSETEREREIQRENLGARPRPLRYRWSKVWAHVSSAELSMMDRSRRSVRCACVPLVGLCGVSGAIARRCERRFLPHALPHNGLRVNLPEVKLLENLDNGEGCDGEGCAG